MKDKFIQIRITQNTKKAFQFNCSANKKRISEIPHKFIDSTINQRIQVESQPIIALT
jgi:hypothetical protein